MSTFTSRKWSRIISAGTVTGVVAAAVFVQTPAFAVAPVLTLSSANGPAAVITATITASSPTTAPYLAGVTAPTTSFLIPSCPTTYTAAASGAITPTASVGVVPGAVTTKISNSKATISVPSLPVVGTTGTTKYNVCVYASNTAGDPLVGTATYTVAVATSLTGGSAVTTLGDAISPASGPALGNSLITVSGTGFPTAAGSITATLGGLPLTSITPISSISFTAVTPAHGPGAATLAVTTAAGTVTQTGSFTYANGIVVSPNTSPAAAATAANPVYVDVQGAGFLLDDFATVKFVAGSAKARVWLVQGTYNSIGASGYTVGPVAECVTTAVISDNELICSMNLFTGNLNTATALTTGAATTYVPDGTYTMTVVNNGNTYTSTGALSTALAAATPPLSAYLQSDISSGATFTVAGYNN